MARHRLRAGARDHLHVLHADKGSGPFGLGMRVLGRTVNLRFGLDLHLAVPAIADLAFNLHTVADDLGEVVFVRNQRVAMHLVSIRGDLRQHVPARGI